MDSVYPDRPTPSGSWFDVIFALIVLIASGFSGYTTYLGFSKDLPEYMSIPLAVIIFLGLLGLNFKIRQARLRDSSLAGPLAVFFIVFVFSFISNTNAIYSHLIAQDIVQETQEEAWAVFDRETSEAQGPIDDDPQYQAELRRVAEVETELTNLKRQITDPRNLGLGDRALRHLDRIEELLETRVTRLECPDRTAPKSEHDACAERYEALIRELIAERTTLGVVGAVAKLHMEITEKRQRHRNRIDAREYRRDYTDEMHRDLKWIQNQVNRILEPKPPIELAEINNQADEIGKFKYTWRNFIGAVSLVAIALAVLLGALLDILAPAMSIALYRPRYD